jgi:uncharacterized protein (DUF488 family)
LSFSEILTVGHSNLEYERFLALLRSAQVNAVADVRSAPHSRNNPQFNREILKDELNRDRIAYVFLGSELGGRPTKSEYYCDGIADYEKMAGDQNFKAGIDRVLSGSQKYRIALMCSEQNPLDCHRCLLVGRALTERGAKVSHLLTDGKKVSHEQIEEQLLSEYGNGGDDFFSNGEERLVSAYRKRSRKISYRNSTPHFARG